MLGGPCCVGGLGVLRERVVTHEDEPDVQVGVGLFDGEHLATVARLEEALSLDDHSVREEEVWGVLRSCDVFELLHLVEVGTSDFVQVLAQSFLQSGAICHSIPRCLRILSCSAPFFLMPSKMPLMMGKNSA